jgi:hypothetical protein
MNRVRARHTELAAVLFCVLIFLGLLMSAVGLGIPAAQAVGWLRRGIWAPYPTNQFLADIGVAVPTISDWVGAQRIVDFLMAAPFSLAAGAPLALLAGCVWKRLKSERRFAKAQRFELRKIASWPPPL